MKNLYRQLGVSGPSATEAQIRTALKKTAIPDSLREDVAAVLLNPKRREVYDRHHRTLKRVSVIRANMGLQDMAGWSGNLGREWNSPTSMRHSQLDDLLKRKDGSRSRGVAPGYQKSNATWLIVAGLVIASIFLFCVAPAVFTNRAATGSRSTDGPAEPRQSRPLASSARPPVPPPFNEPALLLPVTGLLSQAYPDAAAVAPFEIRTRSTEGNYYVKLIDWRSGDTTMTAFVRGGETLKTRVPIGTYELRYATGDTWYGAEHLFGPRTGYSRAEDSFDFRATRTGYEGFTVELYLQRNGNLETESMSAEDF